jgi:hypothetical protein
MRVISKRRNVKNSPFAEHAVQPQRFRYSSDPYKESVESTTSVGLAEGKLS